MVDLPDRTTDQATDAAFKASIWWALAAFVSSIWAFSDIKDAIFGGLLMVGFGVTAVVKFVSTRDRELKAAEQKQKREAAAALVRQKEIERKAAVEADQQQVAAAWAAGAPEREARKKAEAEQERLKLEQIKEITRKRLAKVDLLMAQLDADVA